MVSLEALRFALAFAANFALVDGCGVAMLRRTASSCSANSFICLAASTCAGAKRGVAKESVSRVPPPSPMDRGHHATNQERLLVAPLEVEASKAKTPALLLCGGLVQAMASEKLKGMAHFAALPELKARKGVENQAFALQ